MNGIKYRSADEMKDCGIEWIGKIPDDWTIVKAKHVFRQSTSKGNKDLILLSATQSDGVIPKDRLEGVVQVKEDADLKTFKSVREGDFVISLRSFQGGFEISNYEGVITPAYTVFRSKRKIENKYFRSLFKQYGFISKINSLTVGIREGKNILFEDFAEMLIPYPPSNTQKVIANFLDIKTAQFDSIIAKKEQLIAKLEEAKKSLNSEVVTGKIKIVDGQLVPRQPEEMKDSGVEWLGMIPKEWSVRKFSHVIAIANGQVDPRISPFKEMILIAPNHIESNTGRILNLQSAEDQSADSGKYFCDKGDVIYSKIRPALCKACIAPMDCLTSADMYPMKADKKLLMNEWFLMILLSDNFTSAVILDSDRVAMPKVNRDSLSSYKLPVPSLLEQKSILSLIMTKQCEMDSVLEKTNFQISLLKSAKQSLISESVTGKIDLRDWEIIEQGGAS